MPVNHRGRRACGRVQGPWYARPAVRWRLHRLVDAPLLVRRLVDPTSAHNTALAVGVWLEAHHGRPAAARRHPIASRRTKGATRSYDGAGSPPSDPLGEPHPLKLLAAPAFGQRVGGLLRSPQHVGPHVGIGRRAAGGSGFRHLSSLRLGVLEHNRRGSSVSGRRQVTNLLPPGIRKTPTSMIPTCELPRRAK